jgi:RNA polymerase-binding transcription factor DksA
MFYANLSRPSEVTLTARFYSRSDRDQYCAETGAQPIRSRAAKFVPGADRCIAYTGKSDRLGWVRV